MISVSVGEELRSSLARRFWLRVPPELAVQMSAVAIVRGRFDGTWFGETVTHMAAGR